MNARFVHGGKLLPIRRVWHGCSVCHFFTRRYSVFALSSSRTSTSPFRLGTMASGMTLSSSSGSLLRFTQQVQNPKLLAPEMSQKFDEANATALLGTPRCCDTRPYTRGLVL